ncbi:hypothetical protein [Streptomyces sp. NBC_00059]|uniref:hypothetical protein n=1 Tax=Streptomyces sp. NBC_00059 TaxID=2975635 RepID=UPI00225BD6E5|nr:hypothetical protein [Streptomyces sp. NBC_00059]MCX5413853.1 hypothetical protein [Streptomyces sp. NBC_00059]
MVAGLLKQVREPSADQRRPRSGDPVGPLEGRPEHLGGFAAGPGPGLLSPCYGRRAEVTR